MKVLILSPYSEKLIPVIKSSGDSYIVRESQIDLDFCIFMKLIHSFLWLGISLVKKFVIISL